MKYRKGDVVRIVPKRVLGMNDRGAMDTYLNTDMTIGRIRGIDGYAMKEDDGRWFWADYMIAGLASDFSEYEINISQDDLMEMI